MTTGYLGPTVQKEYSSSPTLLALLDDFDQWCDTTDFSAQFLSYVWDISTAQGFGLDIWGRILGQSRYLQVEQTPGFNFGFNINPVGGLVNAINQQFAVGDGATSSFQLTGPSHEPANNSVTVTSMYRNDWQGSQLLYATPRTNSALQSQTFDNATWSKNRATVTANSAVAPDGTLTADTLVTDTSNNTHYAIQSVTVPASTPVTYSVFVKAAGFGFACVQIGNFANQTNPQAVYVNLSNGTFSASDPTRVTVTAAPGGWWCVSTNVTTVSSGPVALTPSVYATTSISTMTAQGDGVSGIYVWGAQFEINPVNGVQPTAYIPTTTAAATVTDYSATSGGVVTLGQVPAVGAALVWNGTFIGQVAGTNWQPWGQAPFYNGASGATVAFPLQDDYYRKLLLVKAAANIASCDCPSINYLMRAMFGDRGRCYVGYDANNPMHIGYHFEFFPTAVEKSIIESGLFPQPAGTTVEYIYMTLTYSPFGFATANAGADPTFVTGWSQGPFYAPGSPSDAMLNNIGGTFVLDQSQLG